jgi:type IV secretory pathway VirB3-like protein
LIMADRIFKGATRPALLLGVPLVPLIVVEGSFFLLALWSYLLVSGLAALLIAALALLSWLAMRSQTREDDQRLHQLGLRMRLRNWRHLSDNRSYWLARTSSPHPRKRRGRR